MHFATPFNILLIHSLYHLSVLTALIDLMRAHEIPTSQVVYSDTLLHITMRLFARRNKGALKENRTPATPQTTGHPATR